MRKRLHQLFNRALDESGGLAIGLVDASGLLIHSAGEHAGKDAPELAAFFADVHKSFHGIARVLDDTFDDHISIGNRMHIHLYRLGDYTLYAFAQRHPSSSSSRVRSALRTLHSALSPLLLSGGLHPGSEATMRQGIEQPQQFGLS